MHRGGLYCACWGCHGDGSFDTFPGVKVVICQGDGSFDTFPGVKGVKGTVPLTTRPPSPDNPLYNLLIPL